MQRTYKNLLITDELNTARRVKEEGGYVVLAYPLKEEDRENCLGDFPYAVENTSELDVNYLEHVLCRFEGKPCHILDTARCKVREIVPKDVTVLYEIYQGKGITDYMENLYENVEDEIAYTKDYIKYHYGFYDFGMWIVEDIVSGQVIGRAGFDVRDDCEDIVLGFMIREEFQQKGYATEVCKALLVYAKDKLYFDRIGAYVDRRNKVSIHLLQNLGFVYDKEKNLTGVRGQNKDCDYYYRVL